MAVVVHRASLLHIYMGGSQSGSKRQKLVSLRKVAADIQSRCSLATCLLWNSMRFAAHSVMGTNNPVLFDLAHTFLWFHCDMTEIVS